MLATNKELYITNISLAAPSTHFAYRGRYIA
jgi:hypothetical protein